MKRILLTLLCVAVMAAPAWADTFILDSSQYFSLLSPLVPDTAGTGAGAPDSVNITIVFQDGTIVLDSAWYNTGDAQGFAVNNRLLFSDQWQDIDGTSGVGTYSVIARWYDGSGAALTIEETHTVIRVWRSLNSAIDSTYAILDTLQNQDNWVAREATLNAYYDTLIYAGAVWIDSAAGNTNTVVGTDGTPTNPVSTLTAAKTIATALGFTKYYIIGKGKLSIPSAHENWTFIGLTDNLTLDMSGADIDGAFFKNFTMIETQGGTGNAHFEDCIFSAVHDLSGHALRCGLTDTLRIGSNNTMFFDQCYSMVAGNGTPVMMFGTGIINVSIRHYSGGIKVDSVDVNDKVSIEGMGQVLVGTGCTNAPITIRGLFTITDNGTTTNFTRDAALNGGYIAEGTSDSVWLRQFSDLTGDAEYDAGDVIDSAKTWGATAASALDSGIVSRIVARLMYSDATAVDSTWALTPEGDTILNLLRLVPTDTMTLTAHGVKIIPLAAPDTGLWISSKRGPAVLIEADSVGGYSNRLGAMVIRADTGSALVISSDTTNTTPDPALYIVGHGDGIDIVSDSADGVYLTTGADDGYGVSINGGGGAGGVGLFIYGATNGMIIEKNTNLAGAALKINGGTTGANDTAVSISGDGPGVYIFSDQAAAIHAVGETYGALFNTNGAAGTAGMGITANTAGDGLVISGVSNEIDFGGVPAASAALDADAQAAFGYAIFNHDISSYSTDGTAGKYIDTTISSRGTAGAIWSSAEKDSIMALIDGSFTGELLLKGIRIDVDSANAADSADTAIVVLGNTRQAAVIQNNAANATPAVYIHGTAGRALWVEGNGSADAVLIEANGTIGSGVEIYSAGSSALFLVTDGTHALDIENTGGSQSAINISQQGAAKPAVKIENIFGGAGAYGIQIISSSAADTALLFGGHTVFNGSVAVTAGVTNENAVTLTGNGTGEGLYVQGGATGHGAQFVGGATSGSGIVAQSPTQGAGFQGISNTLGDGMVLSGAGNGGYGLDISGNGDTAIYSNQADSNFMGGFGGGGSSPWSTNQRDSVLDLFRATAVEGTQNLNIKQMRIENEGATDTALIIQGGAYAINIETVDATNPGAGIYIEADGNANDDVLQVSSGSSGTIIDQGAGSAFLDPTAGLALTKDLWNQSFATVSSAGSAGDISDSAKYWGRTGVSVSGSGAYACSVLVEDDGTPVAGVTVWAYPNGGGTPLKDEATDANGWAEFSCDTDTFLVYIWASGWNAVSVPDTLFVAGANAKDTVEVNAVAVGSPSSPSLTLVSMYFYDKNGVAIKEVPLSYELDIERGQQVFHLDSSKIVSTGQAGWARSDANGRVAFEVIPNDSIVVAPNELGTTRYRVKALDPRTGLPLLGPNGILLNVTASATEKRYPQDF